MERIYNTGTKNDVSMFQGTEVEHTPMYNKKTLFVVGTKVPVQKITETAATNSISHVYAGANQSFSVDTLYYEVEWIKFIDELLAEDLWVTLDFDIKYAKWIMMRGFAAHEKFIPMISAKLPHISNLNKNACLKLDDIGFNKTNEGVWTHSVSKLLANDVFTNWTEYTNDSIL